MGESRSMGQEGVYDFSTGTYGKGGNGGKRSSLPLKCLGGGERGVKSPSEKKTTTGYRGSTPGRLERRQTSLIINLHPLHRGRKRRRRTAEGGVLFKTKGEGGREEAGKFIRPGPENPSDDDRKKAEEAKKGKTVGIFPFTIRG